MAKTPQQVMAKYQRSMQGAAQSYRDGVQNPSKDWAGNYLQSTDRMVQGLQRAIANNVPQNSVRALGTQGWQQKTLAKADRFSSSVPAAVDGYASKVDKVLQAGEAARNAANQIPGTTFAQRIQRVEAAARATAQTWGKTLD